MAIANIKVTLLCPMEKFWDKVTDLNDFVQRSDLTNIRIIDENTFVKISKDGIETYFKVTECIKNQSWSFEIENENIEGTWTGKFYLHGDKTTLDFIENIMSKIIVFKPFTGLHLRKQQKLHLNI